MHYTILCEEINRYSIHWPIPETTGVTYLPNRPRIDIITGPPGSGKSTFIARLMASRPMQSVAIWDGASPLPSAAGRLLLEHSGHGLPLAHMGCAGTVVAVVDGAAMARPATAAEPETAIRSAALVYLNRTEHMGAAAKAGLLAAVWAANPKASVLMDPIDGLNLWLLLDAAGQSGGAQGKHTQSQPQQEAK